MCVSTCRSPYPLIIIHGHHSVTTSVSLHKIKMMKESFHVDPKGEDRRQKGGEKGERRGMRVEGRGEVNRRGKRREGREKGGKREVRGER